MSDEIVIEIRAPKNEDVMFEPMRSKLRSAWRRAGLPAGSTSRSAHLLSLPDLPGMRVCLTPSQRVGKVVDPLGFDENQTLLLEANAVFRNLPSHRKDQHPAPDRVYTKLTQDDVATWFYWMKRLVDKGEAVVVSGSLDRKPPEGRIRVGGFDSRHTAPRYKDQWDRIKAGENVDEVVRSGKPSD